MAESFKTKLMRWSFYLFPAYRGTGGHISYIQSDFHEVRVKIPLNWQTRNYKGTVFGGSMLGATDPIYMLMLIKILGDAYVVWDKSANIRFKKPARNALFAKFVLSPEKILEIKEIIETDHEKDFTFLIPLTDKEGIVHAEVERTIYIAKKEYYEKKIALREQRRFIEENQLK